MKYYVNDNLTTLLVNIEKLHYDKVEELRAEFKDYSKRAREHHEGGEEYERELKAEIKELRSKNAVAIADEEVIKGLEDKVKELNKENEELRKTIHKAVEYKSGFIKLEKEYEEIEKENEELKAVNDEVRRCNKTMDGILLEHEAELKEKDKQYHMLASSKSNHDRIPKEYQAEAEEYFEHNDHCHEVMFFMLDNTLFDDNDDFNDFITKDDAICVISN